MLRRLDSPQFWAAFGAAVIALAGVLIAVSIGLSPGGKPRESWFVVGIVIAVLGTVILLLALALFVAPRRAELTVKFDESDPVCVQDRRDRPDRDFQLRLCAENTGRVAVTGVRSWLKADHESHCGRIRHDNTPPYERSYRGITLRPDAKDWFDIAWCHLDQPQMVLQYADDYLRTTSQTPKAKNTPVEVTFEARREDTNAIGTGTSSYMVAPDGNVITLKGGESLRIRF
jgi:hypothetical protein